MKRLKTSFYLACLVLLIILLGGLATQSIALALPKRATDSFSLPPGQEAQPGEEIRLDCKYPVLSSYAGGYFSYDIEMHYAGGKESRVFDLQAKVPEGFNYTIAPSYSQEGKEIVAIRLDPENQYGETIKVMVRPYVWLVPEPGEYPVTIEASSGELKASIELTAIITAKYDLELRTPTGRLNTEATAGKDNYFTITISNTGTAKLENITFSSKAQERPSGWSVTFDPDKIDSLPVANEREIEVNIKPLQKTISGDYIVTIEAEPESKYAWDNLEIRVTALTPTIWGWVGVGIVIVVIAGLGVMFMRFGRR